MRVRSQEELVQRVNRLPYPPTIFSHGWIYGMWYCGANMSSNYYGQYPPTFVKRAMTMLEGLRILHLCCGRARIAEAMNVDRHPLPEADIVADVERLPFPRESFDAALIDPPYSEVDAERYKVPRLIKAKATMDECARVLVPGGLLFWLDEKYPTFRRERWTMVGLIGVACGSNRRARMLSIFESTPQLSGAFDFGDGVLEEAA